MPFYFPHLSPVSPSLLPFFPFFLLLSLLLSYSSSFYPLLSLSSSLVLPFLCGSGIKFMACHILNNCSRTQLTVVLFLVCVCIAYTWVYPPMCVCVWGGCLQGTRLSSVSPLTSYFIYLFIILFWDRISHWTCSTPTGLTDWPLSLRNSPVSSSQCWNQRHTPSCCFFFLMGFVDINSIPSACAANILLTEPSL